MRRRRIFVRAALASALLLVWAGLSMGEQARPPLSVQDFLKIHWIGDPQLSPDGKLVAFASTLKSLKTNKVRTNLYVDEVYGKDKARRFTFTQARDFHPRFSPDGKTLAFLSTRDGAPQIWTMPVDGGEAKRLTDFPTGVGGFVFSPDGTRIAFIADVWVECGQDLGCLKKKAAELDEGNGIIFNGIPFRVWNSWKNNARSHLFIMPADGKGKPQDLTPFDHDVPPVDLGSSHDVVFSPDGKQLAFVMNETDTVAWNTNNDVYLVSAEGGKPQKISESQGGDAAPLFSPDGKFLAYLSMERAGFEADRHRLVLYDLAAGKNRVVAPDMDKTIYDFVWAPSSKGVYFYAPEKGRRVIYAMDLSGKLRKIYDQGHSSSLSVTPDGKSLVFLHETTGMSPNVFRIDGVAGKPKAPARVTWFNHNLLDGRELAALDEFWFEGARSDKVHGFLMKPPGNTRPSSCSTAGLRATGTTRSIRDGTPRCSRHAAWCSS
jgi:Tol biopolymer transport system component